MATKNMAMLLVLGQEYIRHDDGNFVRNMLLKEELEREVASGESRRNFHEVNRLLMAVQNIDTEALANANIYYSCEMNSVFEAISNCYIPLLNMFSQLEKNGVNFKISLVITPILCTLLSDPVVQNQYVAWLDNRIALGNKELLRCAGNESLLENIKLALEKNQEAKLDFVKVYSHDLLKAFADWKRRGFVELLATAGTEAFLPHYSDIEEVLNAQVETGLKAYKHFFDDAPSGFWLPQMGYSSGLEKILRSYGLEYTVLDAQSVLFSDSAPTSGIFEPLAFENSLGIVARSNEIDDLIFSENGYVSGCVYREKSRDIGFYLASEKLQPLLRQGSSRFTTGYGYWNKSSVVSDAESVRDPSGKDVYDIERAMKQCDADAENFLSFVSEKLCRAEKVLPDEEAVSLVCTFDLNKLSDNWEECVSWLECVFKKAASKSVESKSCSDIIYDKRKPQKIRPYYGAWCGGGYGENFLSGNNSWMIRYVRKASERMVDLTERFPNDTGIKARLLNLGAKELMLAQSCGLAEMIDEDKFSDYAKKQFSLFVSSFTNVFESLGSNSVSTEWITQMEYRHPIFPWMNYRIFGKKR